MIETNIRIIQGGPQLELWTRRLTISGSDVTADRVERACGVLRYRHGLAAVPLRGESRGVLVAHREPIKTVRLSDDNWEIELSDSGDAARCLRFEDADTQHFMAVLVERMLLAQLAQHTTLWTLDSPRIWYEPEPLHEELGIRVFRRYQLSAMPLKGVGIGIAVDVGSAYFTTHPVSHFFDERVSADERRRRQRHFDVLTQRQRGQKGTLIYDNGTSRLKCYLEQVPPGVTCGTTGRIRLRAESYGSLADYYEARCPALGNTREAPAARVGLGRLGTQWVSAQRLWVRVMNDDVPDRLKRFDKIDPVDRNAAIGLFWQTLASRPSDRYGLQFVAGFWRPPTESVSMFCPSELEFGGGARLPCAATHLRAVHDHFDQREAWLTKAGCFDVPVATTRTIHVAYPKRHHAAGQQLADDLTATMSSLTGIPFDARTVEYETSAQGSADLAVNPPGMALFVLDEEPEAYYDVAFRLRGWRVKRVTETTLHRHFANLDGPERDPRTPGSKTSRRWHQFVQMTALDVLQQLDIVLWRIDKAGPYEAQIIIDVGHDRRNVAVSMLVARSSDARPSFKLCTNVQLKADHQVETINAVLLADQLVSLVEETVPGGSDSLNSLAVFRDGRLVGREIDGIRNAVSRLQAMGRISSRARVDLFEVHKDTQKAVRMWNVSRGDEIANALEGTTIRLTSDRAVLVTTGAATLKQGTAQPVMIVAHGEADVLAGSQAFCAGTHLNWSSPRVAQRCSLPLKRTDDELRARSAQEVKRLR